MATVQQAPFYTFTGKIEKYVGYKRDGKFYVRRRPKKRKAPYTERERTQHAQFAVSMRILNPLRALINQIIPTTADKKQVIGKIFSENLRHAFAGGYPDLSIDYSKFLLSNSTRSSGIRSATLSNLIFEK
jgi:hypothetical protein